MAASVGSIHFTDSDELDCVRQLAELLRAGGGRALLVGGCVRDALLGKDCKDFDLEVYGLSAAELQELLAGHFRLELVGASFGVFKVCGWPIDLALPRRENKTGWGHRGFVVETTPDLSMAEAAARRDLTINAILYDPLNGELIDPWGGVADLRAGLLRHVSKHFAEDPLRVLRVMQFAARLDFVVASETVALCRSMTPEDLPAERLAGEWEKLLLQGQRPSLGLRFLRDCGWLAYYPELAALVGCEQDARWHPEGDVWEHTLLALDASVARRSGVRADDLAVGLALLCHDFGKPLTTQHDADGRIRSCGHEVIGCEYAEAFLRRMWSEVDLLDMVLRLVREHMCPMGLMINEASDKAIRRLALRVKGRMDLLLRVATCDMAASAGREQDDEQAPLQALAARVEALAVMTEAPKPIVLGRHAMAMGEKPGPAMGEILQACFEKQLDGEFNDLDGGLQCLQAIIAERSTS
jgi:tRNA nucleotidyltransferase (CCA-adding enzyme)